MKKLRKFLIGLLVSLEIISAKYSYAATSQATTRDALGIKKYIIMGVGILLIVVLLLISYKTDKSEGEETDYEQIPNKKKNNPKEIQQVEEESLYSSYNRSEDVRPATNDVPKTEENEITDYASLTGFQLDELYEDLPQTQNEKSIMPNEDSMEEETYDNYQQEEKVSQSELYEQPENYENYDFPNIATDTNSDLKDVSIDDNKASSLEEDFLRQMNENLSANVAKNQYDNSSISEDFSVGNDYDFSNSDSNFEEVSSFSIQDDYSEVPSFTTADDYEEVSSFTSVEENNENLPDFSNDEEDVSFIEEVEIEEKPKTTRKRSTKKKTEETVEEKAPAKRGRKKKEDTEETKKTTKKTTTAKKSTTKKSTAKK